MSIATKFTKMSVRAVNFNSSSNVPKPLTMTLDKDSVADLLKTDSLALAKADEVLATLTRGEEVRILVSGVRFSIIPKDGGNLKPCEVCGKHITGVKMRKCCSDDCARVRKTTLGRISRNRSKV